MEDYKRGDRQRLPKEADDRNKQLVGSAGR